MRTRSFGSTGRTVSELCLGTWGLSGDAYGSVATEEAIATVDRAIELGITLFDTAPTYGNGSMERLLARVPKSSMVVTKLGTDLSASPARKRFDVGFLKESFERSRDRLRRSPIDVVLLHNPSAGAISKGEAVGFLRDLKAKGDISTWGVSVGSQEAAFSAFAERADVVEIAYNVFCAKDLHDLASEASETAILARSVLSHGLLAGQWSFDKEFLDGDHRRDRWNPTELKLRVSQLEAVRPVLGLSVPTMRAAALRFVLANHLVSSAVLGPRSKAQLEQLVRDAGVPPYLPDATLTDLVERLRAKGIEI